MFKNIIFHAFIGGAIFIAGALIHDVGKMKDLGNFLAYGGMMYAALSFTLILFGVNLPSPFDKSNFIKKFIEDRKKKKVRDELLEYKKLFDEGVLTQEEYDSKTNELKKLIL